MGNNGSKNDDFSRNPNFNIDQHNQAMRQLQANYTEHNYQMNQGGHVRAQTNVTETEFKAVHRTASIYKPSISIVTRLIVRVNRHIIWKSSSNTTVTMEAD